jgi:hypothetical protein
MVPATVSWDDLAAQFGIEMPAGDFDPPKEQTGPEAFDQLPESDQRAVLGPGKFRAFNAGEIKLEDLVRERRSDDWGVSRSEGSLQRAKDLAIRRSGSVPGGTSGQGGVSFPAQPNWAPPLPQNWNGANPGDPQGESMAQFLNPDTHADQFTRDSVQAINETHGVIGFQFPSIPVTVDLFDSSHNGVFNSYRATGQPHSIEITDGNRLPRITMIHELGHLIDKAAMGVTPQPYSVTHPLWSTWRSEVRASQHYQELIDLRGRTTGNAYDAADYSLQTHELWARTYAQYVATRAGSGILRSELSQWMSYTVKNARGVDVRVPQQWDDNDFIAIGQSIDEIFRTLGWRR